MAPPTTITIDGRTATPLHLGNTVTSGAVPHIKGVAKQISEKTPTHAVAPLRASSKQVRETNSLMLQAGHCYLRLFANAHRRQIAQALGAYPTVGRILDQLAAHAAFRRHDKFVQVKFTSPFLAHVYQTKTENKCWLNELRRLCGSVPVRVGASSSRAASAATDDVEMVDVALLPKMGGGVLEALYDHLSSLATQAAEFSNKVHTEIARTAEDDRSRVMALQKALEHHVANFDILCQRVKSDQEHRENIQSELAKWASQKEVEASTLQGDTTLTMEQGAALQQMLAKDESLRKQALLEQQRTADQLTRQQNELFKHQQETARQLEERLIAMFDDRLKKQYEVFSKEIREVIRAPLTERRASRPSVPGPQAEEETEVPYRPPPRQSKRRVTAEELFSPPAETARGGEHQRQKAPERAAAEGPSTRQAAAEGPSIHRAVTGEAGSPGNSDYSYVEEIPRLPEGGVDGGGGGRRPPSKGPTGRPPSPSPSERDFRTTAEIITRSVKTTDRRILKPNPPEKGDDGKRLLAKAPDAFDGTSTKFRVWCENMEDYLRLHETKAPTDESRILAYATFFRGQAVEWYRERKSTFATQKLVDNWAAFSQAFAERFTDRQEKGKDREKLLALTYSGDIQTYLARFNELNTRVGLNGQVLKRVLTYAITTDMHNNICRRHGHIPDDEIDLLDAIREAGIQEEELARSLAVKRVMARDQRTKVENKTLQTSRNTLADPGPSKEPPKASPGQKVAPTGDKGKNLPKKPGNKTGDKPQHDFSPLQEMHSALYEGVSQGITNRYKKVEKAYRRSGEDNRKAVRCKARKIINGGPLPGAPETASSTASIKRKREEEAPTSKDSTASAQKKSKTAGSAIAVLRAALVEEDGDLDAEMLDF